MIMLGMRGGVLRQNGLRGLSWARAGQGSYPITEENSGAITRNYIAQQMPPVAEGEAPKCTGACAVETAAYMKAWFTKPTASSVLVQALVVQPGQQIPRPAPLQALALHLAQ